MKKLIKLFTYLIFIIFFIIILFTKTKISIIPASILFLLFYKYLDKIKDKYFIVLLFIIALLIRIITIIYLDIPISDDFKTMYEASKLFINNDLSFTKDPYFTNFSYQLGFVFIQGIFLKIINSLLFLKVINSIITSLIVVFIFLICRNLSSNKSAKIVSTFYLFYFYPLYLNSILTNQHLHTLLILIIIYLLITKNTKFNNLLIKSILVGLLLGIGNVIRSESIVFLVSFILIGILYFNRKNYKIIIKTFSLTLLIFLFITQSINILFKINNINENGLKNNVPLWKFYVGLSVEHDGMYNENDQNTFFDKSKKDQERLLIERIKNDYLKFPILFLKKEVITFTKSSFNIVINFPFNKNILNFILFISNGILFLILILFLIGIFPYNNILDNRVISILLILFVYFGIYLFIEVSPRYGYNLQAIIFALSGLGIDRIGKFKNTKSKRNLL